MSAGSAVPPLPDDPAFLAARRRATVRDGVLAGRYVLVDGELLRQLYASWDPRGIDVAVGADHPGAREEAPGRWSARVPHARVAGSFSFTTVARHRKGGVLELTAPEGDAVRAVWWRGPNNSRGETIPDGFAWEKNDDYYHGTVGWDELHDVTVSVEVHDR